MSRDALPTLRVIAQHVAAARARARGRAPVDVISRIVADSSLCVSSLVNSSCALA